MEERERERERERDERSDGDKEITNTIFSFFLSPPNFSHICLPLHLKVYLKNNIYKFLLTSPGKLSGQSTSPTLSYKRKCYADKLIYIYIYI